MIEIACCGHGILTSSTLDDTPEKSYSIQTVERLRSTVSASDEIYFLIGADAFAELSTWYRWQDLAAIVTFAVIDRPGASYQLPAGVRLQPVRGVSLPISSSQVRQQLAAGETPHDLDPGVLAYIREHGLYRSV